ncbi:unnamed protein product [Coregonus sp. 'balchen']|nr:unnamed protein product [Coregonus sp. 'balchen']
METRKSARGVPSAGHGIRTEFRRYFRLDRGQFDLLLTKIGASVARMKTNYREPISPAERLVICLCSFVFLATGDSFRTIAFSYSVGWSKVANIVSTVK